MRYMSIFGFCMMMKLVICDKIEFIREREWNYDTKK